MSRRIARLTAVAVLSAAVLLTAACTSSSSSSAQASGITPEEQFTPLFFQCLAQHNVPLWDKSAGSAGEYVTVAAAGKKQGWYVNGKIFESNPESSAWEEGNIKLYPSGTDFKPYQTIEDWITEAAASGVWARVCGPAPSAVGAQDTATPSAATLPMTASIPAPGTSDGTIIAAASPDGRTLAAIDGGHVFFDNVASRAVTATVAPANDGSSLTAEAFSPDGSTLAVADTIGTVFLYDTATHALRATLAAPDDFTLYSVAFSPDGMTLAGADTQSGDTYLWNTATVKRTATIPGPGAGVAGSAPSAREDTVAFAPDGRTLATPGVDGTVALWHLSNS